MFALKCQEMLHNAVDGGFDLRNLLSHTLERQLTVRLDLNFTSSYYNFVDSFSNRRLALSHDAVIRDRPDPGLNLRVPLPAEA